VYVKGRKGHLDRVIPMSLELTLLMKEKLKDPSLKRIRLYDLRHYYGTMLYAQTRGTLYVRDKMGHSKIETTMTYTKLIALPTDEEYVCRAAETVEEAKELIEAGFEYVCDINNIKLFRKRKILADLKGPGTMEKGAVVEHGLRYAPGACVVVGSNPTGPTKRLKNCFLGLSHGGLGWLL